jgi:Sulfotransferase family
VADSSTAPEHSPIFTGGTGRSGSTIVGHLLDHHPDVTLTRPMEVRFIAGNQGFADALAKGRSAEGEAAAELAVDRILNRWFFRAENVGLHTSMSKEFLEEQCNVYLNHFMNNPLEATHEFVYAVMAKVAEGCGASRWVDTTPANARKANLLGPIYPHYKVIVVVRDGRDVAASFVHQDFGPNDIFAALAQWEQRMIKAHKAAEKSPAGKVLTIDLQNLVVNERKHTVAQILAHCDLPPSEEMNTWFDETVTVAGAHTGRWRRDFDESTCQAIDGVYLESCERLTELGIAIPLSAQ